MYWKLRILWTRLAPPKQGRRQPIRCLQVLSLGPKQLGWVTPAANKLAIMAVHDKPHSHFHKHLACTWDYRPLSLITRKRHFPWSFGVVSGLGRIILSCSNEITRNHETVFVIMMILNTADKLRLSHWPEARHFNAEWVQWLCLDEEFLEKNKKEKKRPVWVKLHFIRFFFLHLFG